MADFYRSTHRSSGIYEDGITDATPYQVASSPDSSAHFMPEYVMRLLQPFARRSRAVSSRQSFLRDADLAGQS
jgi:hypothetical protein